MCWCPLWDFRQVIIISRPGLNGNPSQPAIATGRLAARTATEVSDYLAKVIELEQAQASNAATYTVNNKSWQKRIIHFAGGNDADENDDFKGYLSGYQSYAEDVSFGADVALFSKTSSQVIQQLNADSVRQLLRDGAAVMTFFGHASNNSFDISVDDPSLWENKGRYPFVIANSCYTGNIHRFVAEVGSVSENYVLTPSEGAIAFIATPDLSFQGSLDRYTNRLYYQFSSGMYGETIGRQMQQTAGDINQSQTKEFETVALEMTLHGDPGLRIYPHEKSELVVNDYELGPLLSFEPTQLTTEIDSFDLVIDLRNLGRSTNDTFSISN